MAIRSELYTFNHFNIEKLFGTQLVGSAEYIKYTSVEGQDLCSDECPVYDSIPSYDDSLTLENVEHDIIVISTRFTLTRSGSTC